MMDTYFRGTLWMILILLTLPHLNCNMVCPSSCQCNFKGAVKCVGHTITGIPSQLPLQTFLLQLEGTNMNVINEKSLAGLDLVLRFSLTHSHLHSIHPRAFHVVPQLKSVKLSSNDLFSVPARVFSPITSLDQLHLDGNQFETFAPDMLDGLVELKDLDLSRNKLTNLSADVFDGLKQLNFLNLGRNSLKKLPPTIFHSLTQLRELLIYNNELQLIEVGIFDGLVNLAVLKLHYNQITSLPPQVFWSLRNLTTLTLSSNQLQSIPEKSFYNMPKLRKLTIYNNPLLSLPDLLMGHMPDIVEFYLYSTNLTTVPGNLFANLSGLMSLNFHFNEWLHELPSDLFCCLPHIHKLSLKNNNLFHLHPQLFSKLTTLELLFLNDNKLQSLPENIFQGLGDLLTIDLTNNSLKTLAGDIFSSNTALRSLSLRGNPWNCNCSIRGIAKWIRDNADVVPDRNDVLCRSPADLQLRTIGSLSDEEFNYCDATVTSYIPTQTNLHEPTKPFQTTPTSGPNSVAASTITQGTTQQVTSAAAIPTTKPSVIPISILPTSPTTTSLPNEEFHLITSTPPTYYMSPVFSDKLVVEQGLEFVHHNFYKGWVYLWFLTSDTTLTGLLMFCHILLVATGLFLILAAMYCMYRLNNTIHELKAESAHTPG